MPANLCIFEDDRYPNFFPLSLNRPVFDLHIGTQALWKRLAIEVNPEELILLCRPYLAPVFAEAVQAGDGERPVRVNENAEGEMLFLNGRLLALGSELADCIGDLPENGVLHKNGIAVAARLDGERAASFAGYLSQSITDEDVVKVMQSIRELSTSETPRRTGDYDEAADRIRSIEEWARTNGATLQQTGAVLLSYYWQFIGENGRCIVDDFKKIPLRGTAPEAELFKGVDVIREEDIIIGSEVEVRSGTVLDASEGPIIIADRVKIEPNAILYGPCYIGESSIIRGGAKIGRETSLGRECRIGGEVTGTIIASYSNKQHEGFLGHSYVGSWVNLGAGCNNSDLKNNYSTIRAWCAGEFKETGRRFLGTVIGDHAKVAINTRINTGTVIGYNANVVVAGFTPKFVPSFTWMLEPEFQEYDLEKAAETAEIMMDRRNVTFTPAIAELFRVIYRFWRQSGNTV
ncbi:MAG TPA: putative sugar nucleotidyl transferase [Patescibacteria group bacterium]|nr:putative sugar nucleotidyl transferase [Patescibacteria group bacterium]